LEKNLITWRFHLLCLPLKDSGMKFYPYLYVLPYK
jgi:hypothetical protein